MNTLTALQEGLDELITLALHGFIHVIIDDVMCLHTLIAMRSLSNAQLVEFELAIIQERVRTKSAIGDREFFYPRGGLLGSVQGGGGTQGRVLVDTPSWIDRGAPSTHALRSTEGVSRGTRAQPL